MPVWMLLTPLLVMLRQRWYNDCVYDLGGCLWPWLPRHSQWDWDLVIWVDVLQHNLGCCRKAFTTCSFKWSRYNGQGELASDWGNTMALKTPHTGFPYWHSSTPQCHCCASTKTSHTPSQIQSDVMVEATEYQMAFISSWYSASSMQDSFPSFI